MSDNQEVGKVKTKKKVYEKPAITWTEEIEARANSCAQADDTCRATGGPIYS